MDPQDDPQLIEKMAGLNDGSGRRVIQIGLFVTLYFDGGHLPEPRKRFLDCAQDYLASPLGSQVNWFKDPESLRWGAATPQSFATCRDWLQSRTPNQEWEIKWQGGRDARTASDLGVGGYGSPGWQQRPSYWRAVAPLTWFADHEGSWPECVLRWCEMLQPLHGYAGLGIIESPDGSIEYENEPAVYALARRFPGLEVDHPVSHLRFVKDGIKGVNWLTVIGSDLVEKLGGYKQLASMMPSPIETHRYSGGVVIQAGPQPEWGDTNRQRLPKLYPLVAKAVSAVRITEHPSLQRMGPSRFNDETSLQWLRRFDDA